MVLSPQVFRSQLPVEVVAEHELLVEVSVFLHTAAAPPTRLTHAHKELRQQEYNQEKRKANNEYEGMSLHETLSIQIVVFDVGAGGGDLGFH